jgi:signal transduction histidine kinase
MSFRVTARTILQLGAELISSDAIAFYELIKNAFDAGSKRVTIDVVVRIPFAHVEETRSRLLVIEHMQRQNSQERRAHREAVEALKGVIVGHIDLSAPGAAPLRKEIEEAQSIQAVRAALREANYILIEDTGTGMSLHELDEVFLTIGTRARLVQRDSQTGKSGSRPILGEKGVGRLSAMRLGDRLVVRSTRSGESRWSLLELDWSLFSHGSDALLDSVDIKPLPGDRKPDPSVSGTVLRISGLHSAWSATSLREIAVQEFGRLTDPFMPSSVFPIQLRFNGDTLTIPRLNKRIFEEAHAVVEAAFEVPSRGSPRLRGKVNYRLRQREKTFLQDGTHLLALSGMTTEESLRSVGPFVLQLYWFNRRILKEIEGIGDRKAVLSLVNQWGGGLMVYRDGFRVNPYGGPDDDWLDLDRRAFGSTGYKVNRAQIIGKVDISGSGNPALRDQTNREGLQETREFSALKALLQHVIFTEFKAFMDAVDKDVIRRPLIDLADLEERVATQESSINDALQLLEKRYPAVLEKDVAVLSSVRAAIAQIKSLIAQATAIAEQYDAKQAELVHLAGLGLMVEILGHELNRATSQTLEALYDVDSARIPEPLARRLSVLQAQLKTLQKRVRILDPLSTSGRQVKERFDLVEWIREIVDSHEAQFARHGIHCLFETRPKTGPASLPVRVVKGMIVQVIENLISNSVYWLKQERRASKRSFEPEIRVSIDTEAREIRVSDNGPGVDPDMAEEVFLPFVTTKPPREGKGLGLYVSREIARYHGGDLRLDTSPTTRKSRLNTFIFSLGEAAR